MPDWRPCQGKFPRGTWPQNSDTEQQKWPQMTQRLVETATATEKSANTLVKYRSDMAFSSISKTTGFENSA